MNRKYLLKITLLSGLVILALGGWLLHFSYHPPLARGSNLVPFIAGITSIIIVPILFWFRSTAAYAYVINGFLVILGTITMAHFSIAVFHYPFTVEKLFLKTMLPDILMLWSRFAFGKALFDLELLNASTDVVPKGRYFRYPNNGWWLVHLVTLSIVYALGNILWR